MGKIKLTQEQIDDINKALYFYGNSEALMTAHKAISLSGRRWMKYPALNEITVTDLYAALNYGYQVVPEINEKCKVKLPTEVAKAIQFLCYEIGFNVKELLKVHKEAPNSWRYRSSALNGLDYKTLEQALTKGFIEDDGLIINTQKDDHNELEKDDETNLSSDDYMSIIDIALDNGDKVWFDELYTKIQEGKG